MRAFKLLGGISILIFSLASATSAVGLNDERLYVPRELKGKVEFWKAIYTKYGTNQGLLHDSEDLNIIYEAVELPKSGDYTGVEALKAQIRNQLFNILRKRGENLSVQERKIVSKFPDRASRARLLRAAENVRFQRGQSDRFKEGLIRSGYYLKHIEKILKEEDVPDWVKYLPHVESSFQEFAISKFGAAGLWQLMPTTAQAWIRVRYDIDERLDPWLATRAAARHLKRDYKQLKKWPLALTAYNHGPGGVARAVKEVGSDDIADIAFNYSSPSFGFASRNFYVQFLAASDVASNYRKYFGELDMPKALVFEEFKIKVPTSFREISQKYSFALPEFKRLNPALRPPVLENRRPIPVGTLVRVPIQSKKKPIEVAALDKAVIQAPKESPKVKALEIKAVPAKPALELPELRFVEDRYKVQDVVEGRGWIKVEMAETITQLSEWLSVPVDDVRGWNGMDQYGQARLGQKILVKFSNVGLAEFELARTDYHRKIREDFFGQHEVIKLDDYVLAQGENLWTLCYQKFDLPPWLLQDYNPQVSLENLSAGLKLKIPVLRERDQILLKDDLVSSKD